MRNQLNTEGVLATPSFSFCAFSIFGEDSTIRQMRMTSAHYHMYIVTYQSNLEYRTAQIRANGKRRAKTLATQKFGSGVKIVSAVKWEDYQKGKRR